MLGIYSSINKFVYDTGRVAQTSPVDGATVDVPTLSWSPTRETNQYEVVVKDKNGSGRRVRRHVLDVVDAVEPKLDPSGGPYTWTVVSIDASGVKSPLYSGMSFNTSGNDPTYGGEDPLTQMTGTGTSERFHRAVMGAGERRGPLHGDASVCTAATTSTCLAARTSPRGAFQYPAATTP